MPIRLKRFLPLIVLLVPDVVVELAMNVTRVQESRTRVQLVPTKNLIRVFRLDRLMDRATIRRRCLIS